MKLIYVLFFTFFSGFGFSQTQEETPIIFAQCMFDIADTAELKLLEETIRQNENVKVARLDIHTQRSFVLFHNTNEVTVEEFKNLFADYRDSIHCVQIGVYGVDEIAKYPFTNCQ